MLYQARHRGHSIRDKTMLKGGYPISSDEAYALLGYLTEDTSKPSTHGMPIPLTPDCFMETIIPQASEHRGAIVSERLTLIFPGRYFSHPFFFKKQSWVWNHLKACPDSSGVVCQVMIKNSLCGTSLKKDWSSTTKYFHEHLLKKNSLLDPKLDNKLNKAESGITKLWKNNKLLPKAFKRKLFKDLVMI
ncbi:uncharacterized protein VP01_769g6 [Puccinia sorghi]|uniref:Uncharacterized protein n=1 Tax=Puccinia sorghi TaxID=27349 RepID=A0A0L6UCG5_9BASI|nr:uncharacterized protein VP01_769g6 [Puccinia sorghi]